MPVKKPERVPRLQAVFFQKSDSHRHIKFRGKISEERNKFSVRIYRKLFKFSWIFRKTVAATPHLRKKHDVRIEKFRLSASLLANPSVFFNIIARHYLQKGDFQTVHFFIIH